MPKVMPIVVNNKLFRYLIVASLADSRCLGNRLNFNITYRLEILEPLWLFTFELITYMYMYHLGCLSATNKCIVMVHVYSKHTSILHTHANVHVHACTCIFITCFRFIIRRNVHMQRFPKLKIFCSHFGENFCDRSSLSSDKNY